MTPGPLGEIEVCDLFTLSRIRSIEAVPQDRQCNEAMLVDLASQELGAGGEGRVTMASRDLSLLGHGQAEQHVPFAVAAWHDAEIRRDERGALRIALCLELSFDLG